MSIALFMVLFFLVLTLWIGLYFSNKPFTLREYAIGNKQFSTSTLVATVLATHFGGAGLIRTVEQVHNLGIYWIIFSLLSFTSIWLLSPLVVRLAPFMNNLSLADTIGQVYGKYPRMVTALISICASIVSISMQITVITKALSMCMGVNNTQKLTLLSTLIIMIYSSLGGIRAITITDIFQLATFSIIIPLLLWMAFAKTDLPITQIPLFLQSHEKFHFPNLLHLNPKLLSMGSLLLSVWPNMDPSIIQRIYMSTDTYQAKKVFWYAGIFSLLIRSGIILIGVFTFVRAPYLPVNEVWKYIMADIPPLFFGLVSISLLAMAMSTIDSLLSSCAIMITHDMAEGFQPLKKLCGNAQISLAKLSIFAVGLSAMVLNWYYSDLLKLLQLCFNLSVPLIKAPWILAIFGFRGSSSAVLIGMATGGVSIVVWNIYITDIDGSFVCMVLNGMVTLLVHYILLRSQKKVKEIDI